VSAREDIDAVVDRFDARVSGPSIRALAADNRMALIFDLCTRPSFMKLLDAGQDWSVKREEFRSALQRRVARTLKLREQRQVQTSPSTASIFPRLLACVAATSVIGVS
jgi:hypothetical protein